MLSTKILSLLIAICSYECATYNIITIKPKTEPPKIDINPYKNLVSARNAPIDVVALIELAYRTPVQFECALSITFGSLFQLVKNNPLGPDGANVGIVTYNKFANVHLPLGSATAFSGVLVYPTPVFNGGSSKYLNVDTALSLAYSMLNSSRPNAIKQIWVYISETSTGRPEITAKFMKSYGVKIDVFGLGPKVSSEQLNAIASSSMNVFTFPDYCSASNSLIDFVNKKFL
ncbi:unnamed protein product [Gordionus sp. m RMFG-2023]|uniref:collagen alpha-1(XXI) chain-like n=1 Tax=Gordionus sp. m RMFG-2023 TaxID=3053472 RepID=UPI0030DF01F4